MLRSPPPFRQPLRIDQPKIKTTDLSGDPCPAMPRTDSFSADSSSSSEYEDEILFDDIDGVDAGLSYSEPSTSQTSTSASTRNNSLSYPSYSYSYPYAQPRASALSSSVGRYSNLQSDSIPIFASPKPAYMASSTDVASSFEDQPSEYRDLVRLQTRNAAKRQQSDREGRTKRQLEKRAETFDAFSFSRTSSLSDPDSSISPRSAASPASQSSRIRIQPFSASALSRKLQALEIGAEAQARATGSTELEALVAAKANRTGDVDQQLEKALRFASWSKRGRSGVWEPPEGANQTLVDLVALLEGAS